MVATLLKQVPADVSSDEGSLRAAQAAAAKAAALAGSPDCDTASALPELLMAWFYAGYHTGGRAAMLADGTKPCGLASEHA